MKQILIFYTIIVLRFEFILHKYESETRLNLMFFNLKVIDSESLFVFFFPFLKVAFQYIDKLQNSDTFIHSLCEQQRNMMTSESKVDLKIPNDIVDINEAWIIDLIVQMGQLKDCQQVKRILDFEIDKSKWQEVKKMRITIYDNFRMELNLS